MNKNLVLSILSPLLLCGLTPIWAQNCAGPTHQVPVVSFGSGVTGMARVCANDEGVRASMHVKNLVVGNAYTTWFAYVDQPSLCVIEGCDGPDFLDPDPLGVVGRMDSGVAKQSEMHFSTSIAGFQLSHGSRVILILFDHGPAKLDNRRRARQLLTPEDPALGTPGLGVVADGALGQFSAVAAVNIP